MALTVDETNMQATPVLSVPLGVFCEVMGSAALLYNGNYFFQPGLPLSYDGRCRICTAPPRTSCRKCRNFMDRPGGLSYCARRFRVRNVTDRKSTRLNSSH